GAKTDIEPTRLVVPAHRQPSTTPVAELRAGQRRRPLLGLDACHAGQLFGQAALLERQLIVRRHVLQRTAAADACMRAGLGTTLGAGLKHALDTRLDHLAARRQHPRFDLLAGQHTLDEPGPAFDEGDATPVVGQTLDRQPLLLAYRDLSFLLAAAGL